MRKQKRNECVGHWPGQVLRVLRADTQSWVEQSLVLCISGDAGDMGLPMLLKGAMSKKEWIYVYV